MFFLEKNIDPVISGSNYFVVISDVCLNERNLGLENFFSAFLESPLVRRAKHLIILGDLFDVWIGDDELNSGWAMRMTKKLYALSRSVSISIMGGNHDFLIGQRFCAAIDATYLTDPSCMQMHALNTVLLHGDSLCTEDFEYQIFRKTVRQPAWQREFLSQTLEARRAIMQKLRDENLKRSRVKPNDYLSVSNQSVLKLLSETKARRIIHGHAPQTGVHNHIFEGHVIQRWVLPKWFSSATSCKGGGLIVSKSFCQTIHFSSHPIYQEETVV